MRRTMLFLLLPHLVVLVSQTPAGNATEGMVYSQDPPIIGFDITLKCTMEPSELTSDVIVQYRWVKEDQVFKVTTTNLLTIYNLSARDEGAYTCQLVQRRNDTEVVSGKSVRFILTLVVPPEVSIEPKVGSAVLKLEEGDSLDLTCRITNFPKPQVSDTGYTWSFRHRDDNREASLPKTRKRLTIQSVHRNQSGRYSCHASNGASLVSGIPPAASSIDVQVQYLDNRVSLSPMAQLTVVAGDKVTLTCQTDSVPAANLTWLHQGRVLHTVESNEDVYSFTATGCQDSGEYQCRANNNVIKKSFLARTNLTVECPPSHTGSSSRTELSGVVGEELTLSVSVQGNPPPQSRWSGPGFRQTGQWSATLTLGPLQSSQQGLYTVLVSNKHGSFLHTFVVTVKGTDGDADSEFLWLKVGGGVVVFLLCLSVVYLLLRRKLPPCNTWKKSSSASNEVEHQYAQLCLQDLYSSPAELSWHNQAAQPQNSLCQDTSAVFPSAGVREKESDQESEDSESYLACQVVSHGLPPSNLPSHSPTPQSDYHDYNPAKGSKEPIES